MRVSYVLIFLLAVSRVVAGGYEYTVYPVVFSHATTPTSSDFQIANIRIQNSLLRDDLTLRVEVFAIPAGPGYSVLIGKREPKVAISDKEKEYILEEVRRLLIEVKNERETKTSVKK